ncbi:MAG: MutS-related protein [Longibaculum sp.]
MTKQEFQQLHQKAQFKYQELNHQSNIIALIRFLLGLGIIAFLCIGYFQKMPWLYGLSLLCLIVFCILIRYHDKMKKQCRYYQSLSDIYQKHLLRIQGQWDAFENDGNEYLDDKAYKAIDLDILGHHSLFQFINIAFTKRGQVQLSKRLLNDCVVCDEIKKRQEAILDMSDHQEFVFQIEALGHMLHPKQEKAIDQFVETEKIHQQKITPLIFIVSLLTIVSLICLLFSIGQPYDQVIFEVGCVFQLCFSFLYIKKHQDLFEPVALLNKGLQNYLDIFKLISKTSFQSSQLQFLQMQICHQGRAVEGIEKLSVIAQRIGYRQNIFVIIFLNALGLYDFWLRNQYLSWLENYQKDIPFWFDGLAEIETIMSLSVLKIDDFDVTMPKLSIKQSLSFSDLRHPLIAQEKVVGNDFLMKQSVCVITGSNMSGKTTFMRTIGLNLVLAYAGGYVFAKEMTCSPMHILTSMRVKDNVEEGISTFYGELLRIKDMIAFSKNKQPMICFIDEIFKGTNSLDRIAGAKATIQKLSLEYAMTFLTTHDFELCQIQDIHCQNYHFDEYYENEHIYFDYHIKEGQSQSTNGQFLLRQLGILED